MMHDGGWFGMGGMGLYWLIPVLVVIVAALSWLLVKRRSRGDR